SALTTRGRWSMQPWRLASAPPLPASFPPAVPLPLNPCRHCAPSKESSNEYAASRYSLRTAANAPVAGIYAHGGGDAGLGTGRKFSHLLPDGRFVAASHAGSACWRSGADFFQDTARSRRHIQLFGVPHVCGADEGIEKCV